MGRQAFTYALCSLLRSCARYYHQLVETEKGLYFTLSSCDYYRETRRLQGPLGRHRPADRHLLPGLGRIHRLSECPRLLGRRHREPADHPDIHGDADVCAVSVRKASNAARAEVRKVGRLLNRFAASALVGTQFVSFPPGAFGPT